MARIRKSSIVLNSLTLEGSLIAPAMIERIAARKAGGQSEADYGVPKGLNIRDEMARYFRIGQALFTDFSISESPSTSATIKFAEALFRDVFGFHDIKRIGTRTISEQIYPVTLEALEGRVPVIVVPPMDNLDRASDHLPADGKRRSAATAIQDWLNGDDNSLWGFCCNGESLRLVRDNASLTRPAYIEANLRQIFEGENFADFAALWLLIHNSRFGQKGAPVSDCPLERWREAGSKEGVAARDRLRDGVEQALLVLGNGFLEHGKNVPLKGKIEKGDLSLPDYFTQLLRLVYRLIFLLAAEDRGLLHTPNATIAARKLYTQGYSLDNLRQHAVRRAAWDRHHDRWEGLLVVFSSLARGEAKLGLPALGGLFSPDALPDLEQAYLLNRTLMEAIYRLAWLKEDARLVPINWRDMETEELGSVYESLLELTPRLNGSTGWKFTFAEGLEAKGNARKTTGSYYTPDSLVQALLDSALDPVLDRAERESDDPVKGLLSLSVIDPACGSGHFLLAAARRIASRVARIRAGGVASAEDYRHALRDVVRSCIYGVDRNPMAVELTKVALWIETVEPGKPLGFLDGNIRCGDSLVGIFDLKVLEDGIPDAAYKALTGDDKDVCKALLKENKAGYDKHNQGLQHNLFRTAIQLIDTMISVNIEALPEDTLQEVEVKKQAFKQGLQAPQRIQLAFKANLYVAAFFTIKTPETLATVPINEDFSRLAQGALPREGIKQYVETRSQEARFFHWPLEFTDIMAQGGFDVVLGNPPWDQIQLDPREYFASLAPEISEIKNMKAREKLINDLEQENPSLYKSFTNAKRDIDAFQAFIHESGRFPKSSYGRLNSAPSFLELALSLTNTQGRAGLILPTGIATDSFNQYLFSSLVNENRIISLFSFYEVRRWFKATDERKPFCLLTLGRTDKDIEFVFDIKDINEIKTPERKYKLTSEIIKKLNPNTNTAPTFRSRADADLNAKIYEKTPILINETDKDGNPWGVSFQLMFMMNTASELFQTSEQLAKKGFYQHTTKWTKQNESYLPLYEGKLVHQFDHRWATYEGEQCRDCVIREKKDSTFDPSPFYWVAEEEVDKRILSKGWHHEWLVGWRDITNAAAERTVISSIIPKSGVGNNFPIIFFPKEIDVRLIAAFLGCLNSIVLDYCSRHKVGGTHLNIFIFQQLPILPPYRYGEKDLEFIVPRIMELTFTSQSLEPFARDMCFDGTPFTWDEDRRAVLRAELDAWYARAYDLTRDELRYILDPADVMGEEYPSETFRVLKNNEIKQYGEYRTQRLVLEAWDRLGSGIVQATAPVTPIDLTTLPDGAWEQSSNDGATLPQLAAIIKALPGPTPTWKVRLAALYALEPRYLTNRLTGSERDQWLRLIGSAATPHTGTNISTLISQINTAWGQAVAQLRGMNVIDESTTTQTWAPGAGINSLPDGMIDGWPIGRARFALQTLDAISFDDATTDLPTELQSWVISYAAA